jgi:hypothetical protein
MDNEIMQLENKVKELTVWKDARKKERLVFPLDMQSRKTIDKGLFVFTGKTVGLDYLNLVTDYMTYGYEISINKKVSSLIVLLPIFSFTVNTTTDYITTNSQHNLNNEDRITLTSDGTGMPTPLDLNIIYYIVNRTGNTFQLSLTSGGSPIDMTFDPGYNYYYAKLL